jgi:hypothetical protein
MRMPIPAPSYPGWRGWAGQPLRPVQGGQGVSAGGGDVVYRAGFRVGSPQREAAAGGHGLHVAAVAMGLAGIPQVDDLALRADDNVGTRVVTCVRKGAPPSARIRWRPGQTQA